MERETLIRNSIISDMSEGVMAVRFDGRIELANDAALAILEKTEEELVGSSFVRAFFGEEENDAFVQSVLDAVYEKGRRMESYVPYRTGRGEKQLRSWSCATASCRRPSAAICPTISCGRSWTPPVVGSWAGRSGSSRS